MEITITRDSPVPLRVQLLNQLRHLILSRQWSPGYHIPSEPELKRQLNISRSTIRQALSIAETEGLIERIPGKGTFVAHLPSNEGAQCLIGYIGGASTNATYQYQILIGAERGTKDKGYRVLFNNLSQPVEEDELIDHLLDDQIAGLLIWPLVYDNPSRRLTQLINQGSLPIVLIDRPLPGFECDCVTSSNYTGAYATTKHLVEQGHRHIIFLSRPLFQLEPVAERFRGYQQMLRDANLPPQDPWLVGSENQEMDYKYSKAYRAKVANQEIEQIVQHLKKTPQPTAIFAMHDQVASLALRAAKVIGLRVPDDLSIVGFDDQDIATHLDVPLTTVAQDGFAIGERAAKLLIKRIEGDDSPPRQEIVDTQLIIRASTAPPYGCTR